MAVRDIVCLIDMHRENPPAVAAAFSLATKADAHVTGIAMHVEPDIPPYVMAEAGDRLGEILRARKEKSQAGMTERFTRMVPTGFERYAVRAMTTTASAADTVFASECRLADLVVITQDDAAGTDPHRASVIEGVLFQSGRPTLIVPHEMGGTIDFTTAILAWDGSNVATAALHAARDFLALFEEVHVVTVYDHRPKEDPGADVAAYLARHGIAATARRLPVIQGRDVAGSLVDYAATEGANAIIMGAYGHSRMREFIIGGTTEDMLDMMRTPVLMAH